MTVISKYFQIYILVKRLKEREREREIERSYARVRVRNEKL